MVAVFSGVPSGNVMYWGKTLERVLKVKHIAVDTMHWYQVTNRGASRSTSFPLSSALFTKTVTIETTLKNKPS
jgi:hypothetical protein